MASKHKSTVPERLAGGIRQLNVEKEIENRSCTNTQYVRMFLKPLKLIKNSSDQHVDSKKK